MSVNLDYIRQVGKNLRVHGNGFLQLDLADNQRLHIWGHPDIPRQVESSQIHSHRFGFKSTILVGSLVNVMYFVDKQSSYSKNKLDVYSAKPRNKEDTVLEMTSDPDRPISLVQYSINLYSVGDEYSMHPREIHETFVNQPTATLMTKVSTAEDYYPEVFLPAGRKPDNDFDRYSTPLSQDRLWSIVFEVLSQSRDAKMQVLDYFYPSNDLRLLILDSARQYIFYSSRGYFCLGMYSTNMQRWNLKTIKSTWSEIGKLPTTAIYYTPYETKIPFGSFEAVVTDKQDKEMRDFIDNLSLNKKNLLYTPGGQ